jgi:hypothetical protein
MNTVKFVLRFIFHKSKIDTTKMNIKRSSFTDIDQIAD